MSTAATTGFLKFNQHPPRLYVTADDAEFDPIVLHQLHEEGFHVQYLPYQNGGKAYRTRLRQLSDNLELGEHYALLAYGDAAAECLDHLIKPAPHCAALVAYYPTQILKPQNQYPSQLQVLCHLAGTQSFAPAFKCYGYPGTRAGFAEHDLDEFDRVAASLAWSRTLGVLRKAFELDVDLEAVWERQRRARYEAKSAAQTVDGMAAASSVVNVPTMTGGVGHKELFVFYRDYFIPHSPPSLRMKLVSRTIGVDRIVDEMVISIKHTQEIPWLLPNVPPTDRVVHVPLVMVVCIRGGKLYQEHTYWDQASVLVQVGLLDPKLVPDAMKKKGLKRLPVNGSESAAKVLDESYHASNELIAGWKTPVGDPGALPSRPKNGAADASSKGKR